MPAPSIKNIRDLIFYQYAKIIAASAKITKRDKTYFPFIIERVNKLRNGEINMSTILRELKIQLVSTEKQCEYCGKTDNLSWDHLIPQSKYGLEIAENLVLCCKSCNSSKGCKGIYAWLGIKNKDSLSRVVAGKYLKLLFDIHEKNGTLEASDLNGDGKLDVLDLEVY